MSAARPSSLVQEQDVLGALLHSLSQPLTSLRCFLELSLEEAPEPQEAAVESALQQTERVIGMIQLMKDYFDAEKAGVETRKIPFERVLRPLVDDLASVAEVRGIDLHMDGTSSVMVPLPESRLRLALQYLLSPLLEAATPGVRVVLCLEESPTGAALRAGVVGGALAALEHVGALDMVGRVKVAIAQRILESAGMRLTIEESDHRGFLLRIPRLLAASRPIAESF